MLSPNHSNQDGSTLYEKYSLSGWTKLSILQNILLFYPLYNKNLKISNKIAILILSSINVKISKYKILKKPLIIYLRQIYLNLYIFLYNLSYFKNLKL